MTRRVRGLAFIALLAWSALVCATGAAIGVVFAMDRLMPIHGSLLICEAFGVAPR